MDKNAMKAPDNIPWQKLYDFVLSCGNIHEPKQFSMNVLSALKELCYFDQALIYFIDGNGKVYNQYLLDIDEKWSNIYLGYYSKIENRQYGIAPKLWTLPSEFDISLISWKQKPNDEFISDYIRPRGLKYSLGFALRDTSNMPRTIIALDRIIDKKFTDEELQNLWLVIPQLNNLHQNLFYQSTNTQNIEQINWKDTPLTPREIEIANRLCQGMSPINISNSLHIALSTANKHISHIYEKMCVSNKQELLVRLLG